MNWDTPIGNLAFVGPVYSKRLEKLEIFTIADLLYHAPTRYEDYTNFKKLNTLHEGDIVTIKGRVSLSKNLYTRSRKQIQTIKIQDGTGEMELLWFNQPFILRQLIAGKEVALAGTVIMGNHGLTLSAPDYELIRDSKSLIHMGRLVPRYPETQGVSSKWLRSRIAPLLDNFSFAEFLPSQILQKYRLWDIESSLKALHFPQNLDQSASALQRLAFEELFGLQLLAQFKRKQWNVQQVIKPFQIDEIKMQKFLDRLPFTLTGAQKRVAAEIIPDLKNITPMNRMLQGEVGSGKTVIAALISYIAVENQKRVLFMAPTEILAQQHYKTLSQLLTPFGLKVGIQTGSIKNIGSRGKKQETGKKEKKKESYDILVGTHALLTNTVQIPDVGLIIIDEQHRFGVRQRTLLRTKSQTPHVMTMTATPIPRSVALTLYGDLDLSVIDEMPVGRLPVKTWVVPKEKRQNAYLWIGDKIRKSKRTERIFIICPFIDPSESLKTVKAAMQEYEYLQKQVFPEFKVGLLHGKLKSRAKEIVLENFRTGEFDILVSTPVVEVGIDIPEATVMLIEAADRFGLAQLHQLRGRVGRGTAQSYCLLFAVDNSARLKNMEKVSSGIQLAEIDLKLRGWGALFGFAQHGHNKLKFAHTVTVMDIDKAKQEAVRLIQSDPQLSRNIDLKQRFISGTIAEIAPD